MKKTCQKFCFSNSKNILICTFESQELYTRITHSVIGVCILHVGVVEIIDSCMVHMHA